MGNSIHLLRLRDINIRIHVTFPLILLWGALQFGLLNGLGWTGALFGVIVFLLLFIMVVLHELGHSFAAQYYGVPVKEIVLLPIGGLAQMTRIPEDPKQEFVIAIAGPMVNFGLAIVMAFVARLFSLDIGMAYLASTLSFAAIFNYLFITNISLGVFNLIPAFPMDGGRILRAVLATQMNYVQATRVAVAIGQTLAWGFGLWGFLGGGFFLILIAFFVYMGAGQEGQAVQLRHTLDGLKVEQAYSRDVKTLTPQSHLSEAIDMTLNSFQADFPVIQGSKLVGIVTQTRLIDALNQRGPDVAVRDVMQTNIMPTSPDEAVFTVQQRMAKQHWGVLPVVKDDQFLGLLTNRDIGELYRLIANQPKSV